MTVPVIHHALLQMLPQQMSEDASPRADGTCHEYPDVKCHEYIFDDQVIEGERHAALGWLHELGATLAPGKPIEVTLVVDQSWINVDDLLLGYIGRLAGVATDATGVPPVLTLVGLRPTSTEKPEATRYIHTRVDRVVLDAAGRAQLVESLRKTEETAVSQQTLQAFPVLLQQIAKDTATHRKQSGNPQVVVVLSEDPVFRSDADPAYGRAMQRLSRAATHVRVEADVASALLPGKTDPARWRSLVADIRRVLHGLPDNTIKRFAANSPRFLVRQAAGLQLRPDADPAALARATGAQFRWRLGAASRLFTDMHCATADSGCEILPASEHLEVPYLAELAWQSGTEAPDARAVRALVRSALAVYACPDGVLPVGQNLTLFSATGAPVGKDGPTCAFGNEPAPMRASSKEPLAPIDNTLHYGRVPVDTLIDTLLDPHSLDLALQFLTAHEGEFGKEYRIERRGLDRYLAMLTPDQIDRIVTRLQVMIERHMKPGVIWYAVFSCVPEVAEHSGLRVALQRSIRKGQTRDPLLPGEYDEIEELGLALDLQIFSDAERVQLVKTVLAETYVRSGQAAKWVRKLPGASMDVLSALQFAEKDHPERPFQIMEILDTMPREEAIQKAAIQWLNMHRLSTKRSDMGGFATLLQAKQRALEYDLEGLLRMVSQHANDKTIVFPTDTGRFRELGYPGDRRYDLRGQDAVLYNGISMTIGHYLESFFLETFTQMQPDQSLRSLALAALWESAILTHVNDSYQAWTDWDDEAAFGTSQEARILWRLDPRTAGERGLTATEFRALCEKMTNRVVPGDRGFAPALAKKILQQFFDNYPAEFTDMALSALGEHSANGPHTTSHALGMLDAWGGFVDQLRVEARSENDKQSRRATETLDKIADQFTAAFSRLTHPWEFKENSTQTALYRLIWLIEDKPARCTMALRTQVAWALQRTSVARQESLSTIDQQLNQLAHACGMRAETFP